MPRLVNTELLINPVNWIIVWLMVGIGAFVFALLDPLATARNSDTSGPPASA